MQTYADFTSFKKSKNQLKLLMLKEKVFLTSEGLEEFQ